MIFHSPAVGKKKKGRLSARTVGFYVSQYTRSRSSLRRKTPLQPPSVCLSPPVHTQTISVTLPTTISSPTYHSLPHTHTYIYKKNTSLPLSRSVDFIIRLYLLLRHTIHTGEVCKPQGEKCRSPDVYSRVKIDRTPESAREKKGARVHLLSRLIEQP